MKYEELQAGQLVEVATTEDPDDSDLVIILRSAKDSDDGKVIAFSEAQEEIVALEEEYEYVHMSDNVFDFMFEEVEDTTSEE